MISVIVRSALLACVLIINLASCQNYIADRCTPKQYLNIHKIGTDRYLSDINDVKSLLNKERDQHTGFFYSKEFDHNTEIIIDTIIYDASFNKLAVLVIAKNGTKKQLQPDENHKWYYDGTCYLGLKQHGKLALSWLGPTLTNSPDLNDLSEITRETFFCEVGAASKEVGYNIDDIRFWHSPIWKNPSRKWTDQ